MDEFESRPANAANHQNASTKPQTTIQTKRSLTVFSS